MASASLGRLRQRLRMARTALVALLMARICLDGSLDGQKALAVAGEKERGAVGQERCGSSAGEKRRWERLGFWWRDKKMMMTRILLALIPCQENKTLEVFFY